MDNIYYNLFKVQKQTPEEDGKLPLELQFFEDLRSQFEDLFTLNIFAHHKDAIDYNLLCLETVDFWLRQRAKVKHQTKQQKVLTLQILKGRRLLRSAQLILIKGFLPESEILLRSLLETQLITNYLVDDHHGERLRKYLEAQEKNIWGNRFLCEELFGIGYYDFYKHLCLYTHPSFSGLEVLLHGEMPQASAIHDYEKVAAILISFGNMAVSLCELANGVFPPDLEWDSKHYEIYDTDIFQKNYDVYLELYKQGDERFNKLWERHKKTSQDQNQGVGKFL